MSTAKPNPPAIKTEVIPGAGHDLLSQVDLVSSKAVEFLARSTPPEREPLKSEASF